MAFNFRPMSPTSYVSFVKATETIWGKMKAEDRLDNVLYFVVDGANDDIGKLYLGNTLISDGSGLVDVSLSELDDVKISLISGGDILMYDMADGGQWKNVNLASEIGNLIKVFTGADETKDGTSGLVPQPSSQDFNKFLKGDGTWANPTEGIAQDISGLKATVATLVGTDANASVRVIATAVAEDIAAKAVAKVVDDAPESFNTLKEIAAWIADHPETADFTALQTTVNNLNKAVNGDAENNVEGLVAQVGTLVTTVADHKTRIESLENKSLVFTTDISDLKSGLNSLTTRVTDTETAIGELAGRLMWQELYEITEE
jgi:hypothetical protein